MAQRTGPVRGFVKRAIFSPRDSPRLPPCRPRGLPAALAGPGTRAGAAGLRPDQPGGGRPGRRSGSSRSASPRPVRWSGDLALDYASTIEHVEGPRARYDLDSEILRLRLRVARDLGPALRRAGRRRSAAAIAGFLDGFLDWYHGLLGIRLEERDRRPRDAFLYQLELPDGATRTRRPERPLPWRRAARGRAATRAPACRPSPRSPCRHPPRPPGYGRGRGRPRAW